MDAFVRVLTIDDSPVCLALLREILEADGDIAVVCEASGAEEAKRELVRGNFDLVTVDLHMPGLDGLSIVAWIMAVAPKPVLIVSGHVSRRDAAVTLEALRRGALDVAPKPDAGDRAAGRDLRERVRALAKVPVVRHVAGARAPTRPFRDLRMRDASHAGGPARLVALGASAGGPSAISAVCAALPRSIPACVAIVQHLPIGFADAFAEFLAGRTALPVVVAREPVPLRAGTIVLPPDDAHLALEDDVLRPTSAAREHGHRPSVDVLFRSIAAAPCAPDAIGAILSGMGRDGALGLRAMRARGALTIAQDAETAAVNGMPQAARELGAAETVLPIGRFAAAIVAALQVAR
jgi:two-component system, chemotaxis family, protein-glutamate methylesterase/glutaminase